MRKKWKIGIFAFLCTVGLAGTMKMTADAAAITEDDVTIDYVYEILISKCKTLFLFERSIYFSLNVIDKPFHSTSLCHFKYFNILFVISFSSIGFYISLYKGNTHVTIRITLFITENLR